MKRTPLKKRNLPDYTKGEEIFNMVSHIVGGAVGVTVTVLCVIVAALHNNVWGVVSGAIYGGTMIILYTMSSVYHGLSPRLMSAVGRKEMLRKRFVSLRKAAIFVTRAHRNPYATSQTILEKAI